MRLSPSTAISILALFVALGGAGYAATGGTFTLGQNNAAGTVSQLTASTNKNVLIIKNAKRNGGGVPLQLIAPPGRAPLAVNSSVRVNNLNADFLDGLNSDAFLRTGVPVDAATLNGLPATAFSRTASTFADFYALMPGDNAATVAAGAAVQFPNLGPAATAGGISQLSASTFNIVAPGVYMVDFQVSVNEPGQLVVALNGVEAPSTVVGRATGTSQIVGMSLVRVTAANTVLAIRNPAGSPAALTITPLAGGVDPVSAHLAIVRLE